MGGFAASWVHSLIHSWLRVITLFSSDPSWLALSRARVQHQAPSPCYGLFIVLIRTPASVFNSCVALGLSSLIASMKKFT